MALNKTHIQLIGMVLLAFLAGGLLGIIVYALSLMSAHITPDGKVPILDAGLFTSSLLSFQQTVGAIRSVWESQERSTLAEGLQNSTPNAAPVVAPVDAQEAAQDTADAAQDRADVIKGET